MTQGIEVGEEGGRETHTQTHTHSVGSFDFNVPSQRGRKLVLWEFNNTSTAQGHYWTGKDTYVCNCFFFLFCGQMA